MNPITIMNRAVLRRLAGSLTLTLTLLLICAGCGDSENDDGSAEGLEVSDVWTRPTAPGAESTAIYLTIRNDGDTDDLLVGAQSPLCGMAEIHLSSMQDGVMSMSPASAEDLTVAPGEELSLKPGGLHVMCMGLAEQVVAGNQIDVTFEFENAGSISTQAGAE